MINQSSFSVSKEYKEIAKEVDGSGILNEICEFQCIADGIVTYAIETEDEYHEFTFYSNMPMPKKMTVDEIVNMLGVCYFNYSLFYKEERAFSITWKLGDFFSTN